MLDMPASPAPASGRLQRARGVGRLAAKARGGKSVIGTLRQEGCAKIRAPKPQGPWLDAVLINSSGGLTGGDRVDWRAEAGAGAHLVVTTQACERVYRAHAGAAAVETRLAAGPGARLDWLPQETILFEGAALVRRLEVDLAPDATFLGLEAVILGRAAMGETADFAALCEDWRVRRAGVLIHAEATRLMAGDGVVRDNMALLGGARAFATLCYAGADALRRGESLKALLAGETAAGVSVVGEKLVLRATAPSGHELRQVLMPAIALLAAGNAVPRLWTL